MKFIGQFIQNFIARFRSDEYLENIESGTIASGGNLGLDSNNKIVKATEATGDITSVAIRTDTGSSDLATHEIAMNVTDKKIYTKNASGSVVLVANYDSTAATEDDILALSIALG